MTRSAPCSSGRKFTGEANVESTISASPSALHSVATGSRSITRSNGFVGVSRNTIFVFALIALRTLSTFAVSTYVNSSPNFSSTRLNRRYEPPYMFSPATT
jgi:hypothetical protein